MEIEYKIQVRQVYDVVRYKNGEFQWVEHTARTKEEAEDYIKKLKNENP
mgnify:CR=1 FL=1